MHVSSSLLSPVLWASAAGHIAACTAWHDDHTHSKKIVQSQGSGLKET